MRKIAKVVAVIGLVALLSLGTAVAVSAGGGGGGFGVPFAPRAGGQEGIAEALDMSVEELEDALQGEVTLADLAEEEDVALQALKDAADEAHDEAVREAIAEAMEDGDLTAEQAEWMLQGLENEYGLGGRFSAGGRLGKFGLGMEAEQTGLDVAAEALGMAEDELSLQFWAGRSLADVAEAQDVALEDVQSAVEEARVAAMQEAVENGDLTEERAEWIEKGLEEGYGPQRGFDAGVEGHKGRGGRPGGHSDGRDLWENGEGMDTGVRSPGGSTVFGQFLKGL